MIPKFVFSEENRPLGSVETSPCGCLKVLYITKEPYRTMVMNAMTDYALYAPYEANGYRLRAVETVENPCFEVLAKSYLQEDLWIKVGEVSFRAEDNRAIFTLSRIRVKYHRQEDKNDTKTTF